MKSLLFGLHRFIFVRKRLYRLNRVLYQLALRGIGILNFEDSKVSGERTFLQTLLQHRRGLIVLDVGANVGEYSNSVARLDGSAKIYAFEPHPTTFTHLALAAKANRYSAINAAVGEQEGCLTLFDYATHDGSQHASLYRSVIEEIHGAVSTGVQVDVLTVDGFMRAHGVGAIGLLKIDTEGHEYQVLKGAMNALCDGGIEVIHFEFNEMNVISRVFMKDFFDLLKSYRLYRMFPDGLVELVKYSAITSEIFAYQNIVAVHSSSDLHGTL